VAEAYAASPRSNIVVSFNAPVGTVLNYRVRAEWWTVEGAYENWISTRKPPLFGTERDCSCVGAGLLAARMFRAGAPMRPISIAPIRTNSTPTVMMLVMGKSERTELFQPASRSS
jgi:hypothetical protein